MLQRLIRRPLRKGGSASSVVSTVTGYKGSTRSTQRGPQIALRGEDDPVPIQLHQKIKKPNKNKYINNKKLQKDKHKRKSIQNSLIHGDKLGEKGDGTTRLVFENFNGLAAWQPRNDKIILARKFLRRIKADGYAGAECRSQWDLLNNGSQLKQLFQSEVATRAVTAHNEHEDDMRAQEGGTGMVVFDQLAGLIHQSGVDLTGLGRWCWFTLKGKHKHVTRIITAYQPCRSNKSRLSTVYSQHRRYYRVRGDMRCPRAIFRADLGKALKRWRGKKERIILFIDANEDLHNGPLVKMLRTHKLKDLIQERTGTKGPNTYHSGKNQIDGVYVSEEVDCTGARYLPFWSGIGDHRAIVIDIPHQVLFGEQLLTIQRPSGRRLRCDNEESVTKYTRELRFQLHHHKIAIKIQNLINLLVADKENKQKTLQNQIDRVKGECMISAEKKCRQYCLGEIDFSPDIRLWKRRKLTWKLILKYHQGYPVNTALIRREASQCQIESPLSGTLPEAMEAYTISKNTYYKLRPHAPEYRKAHLRKKVKEAEGKNQHKRAKEILQLITRERIRDEWKCINRAVKQRRGAAITKVVVQKNGVAIEVNDPEELEPAIMNSNRKRFHLTDDTPLMGESVMNEELGFLGATKAAEQILNGTYKFPPNTDVHTIGLLKQLGSAAKGISQNSCKATVSKEEFKQYWKGRKEKTSSSFSGLHFGHWKAAATSDDLSTIHAKTIELAFMTGTPLERWCIGLSVMLEKKPGVIEVDKLRAILLMEADFNFANHLYFGRRMKAAAEEHGVIPEDTFGSRENKSSIEVSLCRMLFFDLVRQLKFNAVLGSYDAQSCYDRVVHSFTSMAVRAMGIPMQIINTMLSAIQMMQFHLRTGFGDSKETYGSDSKQRPFQGLCQGNGASPALWLLISSFLLMYLANEGHSMQITSAITCSLLSYVALMFVDDGDFPTMAINAKETIKAVVRRHQATVTCWAGCLKVTGGALKPEKCFWYPIQWKWTKGIAHVVLSRTIKEDIYVTNPDGIVESIPKLDYNETREVMGVVQAPSGTMEGQISKLKNTISKWTPLLTNGYLHRRLVWRGFWGKLWPALRYPLPATTLSSTQSKQLLTPLYKILLPKLGVTSAMPVAYRVATEKYYGLGLPSYSLEQTIEQLTYYMMHITASTLTGQHMRHTAEQLQLELGIGQYFMHKSYRYYGKYITDSWMRFLWKDISRLPIVITHRKPPSMPLQRENDQYIMEIVLQLDKYNTTQLKAINNTRIFHQCYTLADIMTGAGDRINYNVKTRCQHLSGSTYGWPATKPCKADFDLWDIVLGDILELIQKQSRQLGSWVYKTHSKPHCMYHSSTNAVYVYEDEQWLEFKIRPKRYTRSEARYQSTGIFKELPVGCQRGTYYYLSTEIIQFEGAASVQEEIIVRHNCLQDIFTEWGETWVWKYFKIEDEGLWLDKALREGTAILICDGSYQPKLSTTSGAAAWTIECTQTKQRIISVLPSTTIEANAYRSELIGLYASLAFVLAITDLYNIKEGSLLAGCDNETGLYLSSLINDRVSPKQKHSDVLRAIRHVRRKLKIDITFKHISAHQDDTMMYHDLDRPSQLNVDCDLLAKAGLRRFYKNNDKNPDTLPHELVLIHINGCKITGDIGVPLRNEVSKVIMRKHLISNHTIIPTAFDMIDWDAIAVKMSSTKQQHKIWITKHVSGFCATNKMMHRRGHEEHSRCPCCHSPDIRETTRHQARCLDPERIILWNDSVDELNQWLTKKDTEPNIQILIIGYLRGRGEVELQSILNLPVRFLELAMEQDTIGWDNFTEGKISCVFRKLQHEYLVSIDSRKTALQWTSQLISKLLLLVHSQWIYRNSVVHKRTRDGLKKKERAYINSKIHQQFALGDSMLEKNDSFLLGTTTQDILALSGVEKKTWLRAVTAARLVGKNKRKRRRKVTSRTAEYQFDHADIILSDTEEDNRRKKRRQWDSCTRKRVKEK